MDEGAASLLSWMLEIRPARVEASDLPAFWAATESVREAFTAPIDRAVAGGFLADRIGFAFASGYEAALGALLPGLARHAIASLAVTEETGNHPRAIRTRLEKTGEGYTVTGRKRWSTLAPLASTLIVIATTGEDARGRPILRAVRLDRSAPGIDLREMPPTAFVPEVPHAETHLDKVSISESAILPGDGYADYVKPFRTIEDLHVRAAFVGYLCSVALLHDFPRPLTERWVARAAHARALASLDPKRPETHLALAGFLSDIERDGADAEPHLARLAEPERARYERDRVLFKVASASSEQRRVRAWERLGERRGTAAER